MTVSCMISCMMMRSLKANGLQSKGPLKPVSFQAAGPTRLRIAELAGERAGHMSKKKMSQVDDWFALPPVISIGILALLAGLLSGLESHPSSKHNLTSVYI